MIDEKVLIERLKKSAKLHKYSSISHIVDGLNFAIGIVLDLAKESKGKDTNVPSNNGWIACSERFPSEEQKVLAYINPSIAKHEIILIPYESWNVCWHDGSIIAWMPLPALYQPNKKGED